MFWCICGGGGLGLLTILGIFVLAENIGTVLEVFVGILIVALIIGCLYQLSLEVGSNSKASEKKSNSNNDFQRRQ